jgi:hypothetical protein
MLKCTCGDDRLIIFKVGFLSSCIQKAIHLLLTVLLICTRINNSKGLEINSISVFGWSGYEEIPILLGSLVKLLSYCGIILSEGPEEQEFLDTLST